MEVLVVVAILVVLAGTGGVIYMQSLEDAKRDLALSKAKELTGVVERYALRHGGEYPPSLDILTQPTESGKPYLEVEMLVDPWGKPYQYVPSGPNHNGVKPDIFTTTQTGVQIGNWMNQ